MAAPISVCDFVQQVQEDLSSPTTSTFTSHMARCKATAGSMEEALDADRAVLQKMRKAAKAEHGCGQDLISHLAAHIAAQELFSANYQLEGEQQLANAFSTFAAFSQELLIAVRSLLQSLDHNINFSLESLIKGDMKEIKGEFKKPLEKAYKDYESKLTKIEKEKRELAKQHGMVRGEVSGGEIAEEMEKERRSFQLNMCEYLIKVNEIKTKKGIDLLQNHIKYCNTQFNFFQECLNTTAKLKKFTEELIPELQSLKVRQDEEKKQLCALRDQLKAALQLEQREDVGSKQARYNMHQLQGNKQYGTEKTGTLFKKSDGLRKVWQKRKCTVSNGYLTISHSMSNRPPAKLNLLTCQVKPNVDDKKCFDLVSHNRTYRFLAEDEQDCFVWVSVLSNSKEEALNVAFSKVQGGGESSREELTRAIVEEVRNMPGNRECCDCLAPDPTWLSINHGILICIECSGIHREMGVHISRIQSLSLDKLATSELLLARNIGNAGFNGVMEASLSSFSLKPMAHSDMALRKEFITSKYVEKKYAKRSPAAQCPSLPEAVKGKDIFTLLQAYAENVDLSKPVQAHLQEPGETILHLAVLLSDRTSLHIVDFLVQNSGSLEKQTIVGNTPLHYCCFHNKPECLKLLLKAKASIITTNQAGETALDIAKRTRHHQCAELLLQAQNNQFSPHVHVEYEWWLGQDDMYESDDELDEKLGLMKRGSSCPQSCFQPPATRPEAAGAVPQGRQPDTYALPHTHLRSLDVPPAPSYPPPFPPHRAKSAPERTRPLLTSSSVFAEDTRTRRSPSLPLSTKHKRTSSDPAPWVPLSPEKPILGLVSGVPMAVDCLYASVSRKAGQPGPHQSSHESDPSSGSASDVPPPLPRRGSSNTLLFRRVRALYDCSADRDDELTFHAGEIIVVSEKEDDNWWKGWIEGQPHRQGAFPASFVHVLNEEELL
ncbi:arf-GAP with SH3 domain, ANK repeat and PH domain-containing protein 2-like isoform X1 [Lagopus muta]|uniref:arf-GAP with SH3 domain, ANK repeat and PH domain-containing protein 2-like isoform X1 n=1 Tax=Lagopus muta TaxID=64668 RepID=UPI0020A22D62|nr:arf-GAP with SH3 domain, ANK repeat and PH domain-containing protein 2-like isoform X1 [Lagopus muta]